MIIQSVTFKLARLYVQEARDSLQIDADISARVLGWIRARDVTRLSTCSKSVSLA
jgi:hypothetical protein